MAPSVAVVVEHGWHRVPGGTATAVNATLVALVERGDLRFSGIAAAHRSAPSTPIPIDTHHHWLPRPALYEAWHRLGLPRSGREADVIWAPAMAVPPASRPLVVTVHDVDFLEHPERLSRRGASFFPRAWRAATDRADRIVVPSRTVGDKLMRHGVEAGRVDVIPWGVDGSRVSREDQRKAAERLGLPERFVLWVGTAEPRKNLPGLVAAMQASELRDVPLVIVGPAGWGVDLDATVAPLGDRVLRLGVLDRGDLLSVYARATVFAYPSFDEGFGLPVLEAMAQGTAVVTSSGTATEEAAGGAAELVDPNDPSSISAGIVRLLADDDLSANRTAAGLERAGAATWQATADRYAALFHVLAEAPL